MKSICFFVLLILPSVMFADDVPSTAPHTRELHVVKVTPTGDDVPAGSQIVIQFDRSVAPLGQVEKQLSISFNHDLKCQWQWLSSSELACNLNKEDQLQPATSYKMIIDPHFITGYVLSDEYNHSFTTTRPKVERTWTHQWLSPTKFEQAIAFNQPAVKHSVERSIYFLVNGKQKIAATARAKLEDHEEYEDDGQPENQVARLWLVAPIKELPLDADVSIKLVPGLRSIHGPETNVSVSEVANLSTFPDFSFLGIRCYDENKQYVLISPGESTLLCTPNAGFALAFSSPVSNKKLHEIVKVSPEAPRDKYPEYDSRGAEHFRGKTYDVWMAKKLQAKQKYKVTIDHVALLEEYWIDFKSLFDNAKKTRILVDEFGRPLTGGVSFSFQTDHFSPERVLPEEIKVLNKNNSDDVLIEVVNMDSITLSYQKETVDSREDDQDFFYDLSQKPRDVEVAVSLGIRELLEGNSGIVYGRLSVIPEGRGKYPIDSLLFEVTPYRMHAKVSDFNTLIWLTDSKTGKPIANAKISLDTIFSNNKKDTAAKEKGVTDSNGLAIFAGNTNLLGVTELKEATAIKAELGKDMALLPLTFHFLHSSFPHLPMWRSANEHSKAWVMTSQGVYHPGERVEYKIYVREQNLHSLTQPHLDGYSMRIVDPRGEAVFEKSDITLSEFGTTSGEFITSTQSVPGWYNVYLTRGDKSYLPTQFLLAEFTPASFAVHSDINGAQFTPDQEVEVTTTATLYGGGPYQDASSRVIARLESEIYQSNNPQAKNFTFYSSAYKKQVTPIFDNSETLDEEGQAISSFFIPKQSFAYGKLNVENSVMDDRGKYIATKNHAKFFSSSHLIGLKTDNRINKVGDKIAVQYLVVDQNDSMVNDHNVEIQIARLNDKNDTKTIDQEFKGKSSSKAPQSIEFTLAEPGSYRVTASHDNTSPSELVIWVTGEGTAIDDAKDLVIVAEKEAYKVGDVAKFVVQNITTPTTALVTVERDGILDSYIKELSASNSLIELPIKPDYLPGFYLSVLVNDKGTKKDDYYRLGYERVEIQDDYKKIAINIQTSQEVYSEGDKVTVKLKSNHQALQELAVVVLDEAVFDLVQKGKFAPYDKFYQLGGVGVSNYNLFNKGSKYLPLQRGAIAFASPASLADSIEGSPINEISSYQSPYQSLIYWNPTLQTDQNGNAEFTFTAPKKVGSWCIIVVAIDKEDRPGMSMKNIKTTRLTEIVSLLPNQIVEGDSFDARFSVTNHAAEARSITIKAQISNSENQQYEKKIMLFPRQKYILAIPVTSSVDYKTQKLEFSVTAGDQTDEDKINIAIPVKRRYTLQQYTNYNSTLDQQVKETIVVDKSIIPEVSNIEVKLSATVLAGLEDNLSYLHDYDYAGFEAMISRAVAAANYKKLQHYLRPEFTWQRTEDLISNALKMAAKMQSANGGISYYTVSDANANPYLSAYTALSFNALKKNGYQIPQDLEDNLLAYLKAWLHDEQSTDFYSKIVQANIKSAVALALAENNKLTNEEFREIAKSLPLMSIFGKANCLKTAITLNEEQKVVTDIVDDIMAYANESSGKITFTEQTATAQFHFLSTKLRDSCTVLDAFSALPTVDVPYKILRGILQSKKSAAYWSNPHESATCNQAFLSYSTAYEQVSPTMSVSAKLGSNKIFNDFQIHNFSSPPGYFSRKISNDDFGKTLELDVKKEGKGRLYYSDSIATYKENAGPTNFGIEVHREYRLENGRILKDGDVVKRGDLITINLLLSVPSERNFVIVEDHVLSGLEPININLATSPEILPVQSTNTASQDAFHTFYHQELRNDRVRFYSTQVASGTYRLSYNAQAIASGHFVALPATAHEAYDQEVYGSTAQLSLRITDEEAGVIGS